MKIYQTENLRNLVLVGPQGSGKTTFLEALYLYTGLTNRLGRVEDGNTISDYTEEEIERKISLHLSSNFVEYNNHKINILDTPGYYDFSGELAAGLAVAEVAVLVLAADAEIDVNIENFWEMLAEQKKPAIIVINKTDKGFSADKILAELKKYFGEQVSLLAFPHSGGTIDLLKKKFYPPKGSSQDLNPQQSKDFAGLFDKLLESIAASDEKLIEKYLEGQEIPAADISRAFSQAIKGRQIFPVLAVDSLSGQGIGQFLDFVIDYLPAPEKTERLAALVYKTVSEPGAGQMSFVRIFGGGIKSGTDIYNLTRNKSERVGQIVITQGKKRLEISEGIAGDLVVLLKLRDSRTNDILSDGPDKVAVNPIPFPEALYQRAIHAASKAEEEKLGQAMAIITLEDPTIRYQYNSETRQMVVSGLGNVQLEVMAARIKKRYGIDIILEPARVPYKETITSRAEVQGKYKRQSGGRGQYGDCWLRLEPRERGAGFEFVNKIVGGVIPRNYIPAVEKGVREAMDGGVIAGYPVVDLRVTVYDGSYHEVDSSDMAFKIAGAMALRKGVEQARPAILEPIMNITVIVPEEFLGAVMGDLNSRRGRVLGMEKAGRRQIIKAQAPLKELFEYPIDLRSLTRGAGKFTMSLSHYEFAPSNVSQPLIEQYQKSRSAEAEQ